MNKKIPGYNLIILCLVLFLTTPAFSQDVKIIDSNHYSNVFGESRNYRIFLPPGYEANPSKRYPVIYYYHGWSQRYFGDTSPGTGVDKGSDNQGDNIANYVAAHDVIVVKTDGYNRTQQEEYYLRPYNVSPVETYRQFPLYFPEIINYIDLHYRTIPDRGHRAISGLSMGGFMTMWIGGKYPHLLCAAGNFCGSAEFMIGPKEFPVEYRHLDMYDNYPGVNVRLNYGNKDFIRYYHRDMNRVWTQVKDNYEYKMYDAGHSTCGLGEMFDFIMKTFENPPALPEKWDHIDIYPSFSVWDYTINSNRELPGFTVLENVNLHGFRCSVREFLPDGTLMPFVKLSVTTPPLYDRNAVYTINDMDIAEGRAESYSERSDDKGRLTIRFSGSIHEIGINRKDGGVNICAASFIPENGLPVAGKEIRLKINLLNKGITPAGSVKAFLTPARPTASVLKGSADFGIIAPNSIGESPSPFLIKVHSDTSEIEKFFLTMRDNKGNEWREAIELQLTKDLPEIKDIEIADGRTVTVTSSGIQSVTRKLGTGNGDGKANPGESIVILVRDHGKLWRTFLRSDDKNLNVNGITERGSDDWSAMDHVGGSAKYSIPMISSECREGNKIRFFATYWLPEYPNHIIKEGWVTVEVRGKDQNPPEKRWVKVTGDNLIQVCINDGSEIRESRAKFIHKDDPLKTFEIELNDRGTNGDIAASDNVFSSSIEEQHFGLYKVEIIAEDSYGNRFKGMEEDIFVVH